MKTIFQPRETTFGETLYGTTDLTSLIPNEIPLKFLSKNLKWNAIAEQWFKSGLGKDSRLSRIYGVDKEKAINHIQCIFNTWALTKEQKIANAAFLMSQWFIYVTL